MYKYLLEKHGIKSKFILHPFYEFPRNQISSKTEFVSISRIDFDKNIDILLRVNESISNIDNLQTIGIWGSKNDIYVHHHLTKKLGLDLDKYYKGRFEKTFEDLNSILNNAKFVMAREVNIRF
jgi:glycosyltransferase involved in cell wall biosynthesis